MERRNYVILILIGVAIIGTMIYTLVLSDQQQGQSTYQKALCEGTVGIQPGNCAPNFTVKSLTGEAKELYQTNEKPTYINFWATWCGPCQNEMPMIQKMYQKYKDDINFVVINATMSDDLEDVRGFIVDYKLTMPIYLDQPKQGEKEITSQYKLRGVPTQVLIDADGKILHYRPGEITEQEFLQLKKQYLQ